MMSHTCLFIVHEPEGLVLHSLQNLLLQRIAGKAFLCRRGLPLTSWLSHLLSGYSCCEGWVLVRMGLVDRFTRQWAQMYTVWCTVHGTEAIALPRRKHIADVHQGSALSIL